MNARTRAQSQYTNWNDLASWGWKEVRKTGSNVDLDKFELPLKVFHDLKVDPSEKEWKHVSLTHSIPVTKAGKQYDPTEADYDTYINAKDGMILTSSIFSPDGMNVLYAEEDRAENLPELKHWSDVLFLVWDRYAKGHQLRHIVVVDVQNPRTKQRVEAVTGKKTAPPLWPGVDFSLPTDKAKALLDTPVAKGIAFLLSQHKQQLGVRTVKLIRPFSYIRREAAIRNLYFQVGPVSSSSRRTARSAFASADHHHSEAFSHNLDVHNGTSFLERRVPGQATMHACATVAQAQAAAALGRRYADLMLTSDEEAEQDQMDMDTIAADQLRETGWVKEDSSRFNMNQHLQSYRALLNGLAGADDDFNIRNHVVGQPREQREVVPPISLTTASAERLRWRQNQPYMAGGRRMLPTGAVYTNLLSETDRLLVIEQAYDPKSMTEVDDNGRAQPARPDFLLPKFRSWADITMADLFERAGRRKVTPPRWFLLPGVSEPTRDMELISYCVQTYAQSTHIPAWPGVTFAYGTFCYNVMLGTHMGQEIASFLIKNKHNLAWSDWALLSVTIFLAPGNIGNGGIEQPHVLCYNQRVNEGVIINRIINSNAGLDRPGARILGPTPVPGTPSQAAVHQIVNQYREQFPALDPLEVWDIVCGWLDGLF
ncbi:hypothetical protein HII31_10465 [Pseudocercospora fuligena]|uniref:Uncharacterized protein n=1 Tax=Pseudocercospora fuligena TaxID=685502 RepID=A0A8H6VIM5_9PEZI|nr:hypothetical protein HII31_10465 [Pseudocercospora fuligena]